MNVSMILPTILAIYLTIINIVGFAIMGIDKRKAIHGAWRIPEKTLFGVALAGGALGATIGMRFFRHKTKHWYFALGFPTILVIETVLFFFLFEFLLAA